jgi:hypothetical protein
MHPGSPEGWTAVRLDIHAMCGSPRRYGRQEFGFKLETGEQGTIRYRNMQNIVYDQG